MFKSSRCRYVILAIVLENLLLSFQVRILKRFDKVFLVRVALDQKTFLYFEVSPHKVLKEKLEIDKRSTQDLSEICLESVAKQ